MPSKVKKYHLVPKSDKAKRRGDRPRNVTVDTEEKDRIFVKFEGWNYWVWVNKKGDPHYVLKRGWTPAGEPLPITKTPKNARI